MVAKGVQTGSSYDILNELVPDCRFFENINLYFVKIANIPVYGNIACKNMFLITKIPVYILFNPCAKFTQCACARIIAH